MSEDLGDAVLNLRVNASSFDSGMAGAERKASSTMGRMSAKTAAHFEHMGHAAKKFGRTFSLGVGIPLVIAAEKSAEELGVMSDATANTQATVEKLGRHTRETAGGIEEMSAKIQHQTGVNDALVQSGADIILSLGKINTKTEEGHKVFERSSSLMVDVAARMGTDVPGAAKAMQRVLADPGNIQAKFAKNLGISKDQLDKFKKHMKDVHDPTKRQAMALDLLGKSVEGFAHKKFEKNPLAMMKEQMLELQQSGAKLLQSLLPIITPIIGWVSKLMAKFNAASPTTKKLVLGLLLLGLAVEPLVVMVEALGVVLAAVASPVGLVVVAVLAAGAALYYLYQKSATVRDIVQGLWAIFQVTPLGLLVRGILHVVHSLGGWGAAFKTIELISLQVVRSIMSGFASFVGMMGKLPGKVGAPFRKMSRDMQADMANLDIKIAGVKADIDGIGSESHKTAAAFSAAVNPMMAKAATFAQSIRIAKAEWANWTPAPKVLTITQQIRQTGTVVKGVTGNDLTGLSGTPLGPPAKGGKSGGASKDPWAFLLGSAVQGLHTGVLEAAGDLQAKADRARSIADGAKQKRQSDKTYTAKQMKGMTSKERLHATKANTRARADGLHAKAMAKTASQMTRAARTMQAAADKLAAGIAKITGAAGLKDALYNLAVAMNGGVETDAMKAQHVTDMKTELAQLQAYLQANAANLDVQQRTDVINQMAQLQQAINDAGAGINGAAGASNSILGANGAASDSPMIIVDNSGKAASAATSSKAAPITVSVHVDARGATARDANAMARAVSGAVEKSLERGRAGRNVRGLKVRVN